jgi:hypothetical protein
MNTYIAIIRIITVPIMLSLRLVLFTFGDALAILRASFVRGWRHRCKSTHEHGTM